MDVTHIRELCLEAEGLWRAKALGPAVARATEAVGLARAGRNPHHALGLALTTLGWLRHEAGGEDAAALFAEAVGLARALSEADSEHALAILRHAADFERAASRVAAAEALERESLALLGEALGTDHPRYFTQRERLARAPSR